VDENNTAYRYNAHWDAEFINGGMQCSKEVFAQNAQIHVLHNQSIPYDSTSPLCMFRGVMPSADVTYINDDYTLGGVNNLVFLMMLFEWITASFALDYLASTFKDIFVQLGFNAVALCWNACLFVFSLYYVNKLPYNNMTMGWVLAVIAMVRQLLHMNNVYANEPDKNVDIVGMEVALTNFNMLDSVFGTTDSRSVLYPHTHLFKSICNNLNCFLFCLDEVHG
jgi:hypothetical protein